MIASRIVGEGVRGVVVWVVVQAMHAPPRASTQQCSNMNLLVVCLVRVFVSCAVLFVFEFVTFLDFEKGLGYNFT